jgi:hypothetical protein
MDIQTLTFTHVIISLIGIFTGLVVMGGLLSSNRMPAWTALFLVTTVLTSVTGFFFHNTHVTPGQIVGAISLLLLALAVAGLYAYDLRGIWRAVYVVGAVGSLYLNVFVLVVQSFVKVPQLHALAPKGSEPPFAITQAVVLITFLVVGVLALRGFNPAPVQKATAAAF